MEPACHGELGFICEGYTELFILQSEKFSLLLDEIGLKLIGVINVEGNGNLLPRNIEKHVANLRDEGAQVILVLTDLDEDLCITNTKLRITENESLRIAIAVKQIESWFLADTNTMKSVMRGNFYFEYPEAESVPFDTIRDEYFNKFNKGWLEKTKRKNWRVKC